MAVGATLSEFCREKKIGIFFVCKTPKSTARLSPHFDLEIKVHT